jgi:CBS domain-containing protein
MMKLGEIMTPNPRSARPTDTLDHVAWIMREENVGSIPIVEDDQLVGIVTDRDLTTRVLAEGLDPKKTHVRNFMTPNPITGHLEMTDRDALQLMGGQQIRRLPVVDGGRLVGIVALGDLALEAESDADVKEGVEEALEEISEPAR